MNDLPRLFLEGRRKIIFSRNFTLIFAVGLFLGVMSCSSERKADSKPTPPAVPVTVALATQKNMPVALKAIGNVEAFSTITVKSLVDGELLRVHFQEGQHVKKGSLIFTIDPRPFEATLRQTEANYARDSAQVRQAEANLARDRASVSQAEANLERDRAQARKAEEDARRYEFLVDKGFVAKEQYDQIRTNAEALAATVQADRSAVENARAVVHASEAAVENAKAAVRASLAAVENAKIQLGYCSIRSPVEGRTGNLNINLGNVVKANDTTLVTIHQIHPIYVSFSIPEKDLGEVKKYLAVRKLGVKAAIPGDEALPEEGILTFVDNAVDIRTGTIRLKGTFENPAQRLWPGQFVNVTLTLTTLSDALVIPSRAVQIGQEGPYAFAVKPDLTVELRPLVIGPSFHEETLIRRGLQPGEKVVIDGQIRLVPGAKVEIKDSPGQEGN